MYALEMALTTGRKAMNNYSTNFFAEGQPLNACIIDASAPLMATTSKANLASTMVYATDPSMQLGSIAYGKMSLDSLAYNNIKQQFLMTMRELKNR